MTEEWKLVTPVREARVERHVISRRLRLRLILGVFALLLPLQALCSEPYAEYDKRVESNKNLTALTDGMFGDQVNLYDGATEFTTADIDIPGNNALPVQLVRRLSIDLTPVASDGSDGFNSHLGGAGSWDVDVPSISGIYVSGGSGGWGPDRCSVGAAPSATGFETFEFWHGNQVHIPGRGDQALLKVEAGYTRAPDYPANPSNYEWSTSARDVISCINMQSGLAGEGFLLTTSSGTSYYFDVAVSRYMGYFSRSIYNFVSGQTVVQHISRAKYYILASKVTDRFGNTVQYQYDSLGHPTRIWSSDGREIRLTYLNGRLQQATANGRQWNYTYGTGSLVDWLSDVQLPNLKHWTYSAAGTLYPDEIENVGKSKADCSNKPTKNWNSFILTIGRPSGATGAFSFFNTRHYRSGIHASECLPRKLIENNQTTDYWVLHTPYYFDVMSLVSKTISGPGMQDRTWSYDYGIAEESLWGNYAQPAAYPCTSCDQEKIVTVVNPDQTQTRYRYGILYASNEGRLLGSSELDQDMTVVRSKTTTYMSDAQAVGQNFFDRYGMIINGDDPSSARVRPVIKHEIAQDGVTFNWSVPTGCSTSTKYCFDVYGNPTKTIKSSTVGEGYSRTEQTTYFNQTAKWILGQVASVTCLAAIPDHPACDGGTDSVETETTYEPTYAVPLTNSNFGKLRQTLGYTFTAGMQDGTLHTVMDGNGNTTTLSDWYRGVPKAIAYADGKSVSATVDDNGWITSVVDENGYATQYGYDDMGLLASIHYPENDSTAWNDTTIVYAQIASTQYGISGGHWTRTESTGNARKVTYYDGMWRPLVEDQYDSGNVAATRSLLVKRYDASGRLAFQSYPVASLTNGYADMTLKGADTYYDALDRVTSVQQDSELGPLITTMTYLAGLKTQVTNPRGFNTITSYMAYDQPTTDWPMSIQAADGRPVEEDTDITRDPYGNPLTITRHNPENSISEARTYTYNNNRELCRSVEPETGATLMGYDLAGNLAWSATGLPSTSACDAEGDTAAILERKAARSYDRRNRLLYLRFPDGRGDQDWSYMPDGLPKSIDTYNAAGQSQHVINGYTYNHRRLLTGESSDPGTNPTLSIGYGYDANGHLSSQVWPDSTSVAYQPNALGQPTTVDPSGGNAYAWNVSYYPNGALKSFTYGNGIVHTMIQNDRQLPETSTDAYGGTNFISDSYDYDANGNVAAITDGATGTNQRGNRTMSYDALDRLMYADSVMFANTGAAGHAAYTHDALDNLTHVSMPGTASAPAREWDYCYNQNWQLTNIKTGGCAGASVGALGYDVQGNVTNKDGNHYDFDYGNRLHGVTFNSATVETYWYDGYGRRVISTAPTGTIQSIYSQGGQLLYQQNGRTGKNINYYYLAGSLVNEVETTVATGVVANRFQHTDALGSPVLVTNGSRAAVGARTEYEPYGQPLAGGIADRPGYTGHVADAQTGMDYMQQRYYDPMIGRFLSVDPVTATSVGGNFNRYWYGNDNPYRFVDPDGRLGRDWSSVCSGLLKCTGIMQVNPGDDESSDDETDPDGETGPLVKAQDRAREDPKNAPQGDATYCNVATHQVCETMGVDMTPFAGYPGWEGRANAVARKLAHSENWIEVSRDEAQSYANRGIVVIGAYINPHGNGHLVTVRPEGVVGDPVPHGARPLLNNIGRSVGIQSYSQVFRQSAEVHFYVQKSQYSSN